MTTKQKVIIFLFIIIGLAISFLGGVAATVMFNNNNSIFGAILVTIITVVPSFVLILGTIGEAIYFIEENKIGKRR